MSLVKASLQNNTKTARRSFLSLCGSLLSLFFLRPIFAGQRVSTPDSIEFNSAIASELGQAMVIVPSDQLSLIVPDIAEDGAIVPISVESTLNAIKSILIFVEKNPTPLAARFNFQIEMEAFVSLHIKMNESSDIMVIAMTADGATYSTKKWVKVLQGGCA